MNLNLGGSKKKQHHVRKKYSIITLDLFKPTKKSYPEFDYEKICKEYLKEDESSGEDERFHDREAEEIVRRLEQKYGGKRDKRGHKIRFGCADDYMDKTAGYDLTDPFIDDTEAYDEHVPSALDTARGGFYVNKGKLEFKSKYAEDDEESDVEDTVSKKKIVEKKRKISSDEEEGDSKRACIFPSAKPSVDNGSSLTESNLQLPVRLSSSGAAPTAKPSEAPRSRLIAQQYIKKRRLLGQPPMAKIQSPAVKAALGVKKKLKPQVKRAAVGMTNEDLAGFLKSMTGGEIEGVEELENVISEMKEQTSQKTASTPIEHEADVDKSELPPTDKVPQSQAACSSGLAAASSTITTPKRSPGRPPGSTVQRRQLPVMSDGLRAMIDTYQERTRQYGAPNKKIRLPPSLVALCIRIEEQCTLEQFNHQQKTRIFDLLANWVCVQRNSLYIRMKAYRDRHELNATSDSVINTDGLINETKEVLNSINDEKLHGSNDSSVVTISSSPVICESSPKSPPGTLITEKKEQLIGVKNTTSSDAARLSGIKHTAIKEGTEKMVTTPDAALPSISVTKCWDSSTSSKATSGQSKSPLATSVTNALNNTQLLSVFATMMGQARGDSIHQQQRIADSFTTEMNAANFLSNKQQSELLSQYHLTLSNLAKMSAITPTTMKSSASPKSTTKSDPQLPKSQPKSNRALPVNISNSSPVKGLKQLANEKASHALKEINNALTEVVSEVEKALVHTENEHAKEKARTEKEGKIALPKRFIWTDTLRAALKKQLTLLFTSLEQHGDSNHVVYTTVVQYLYYTVRPLFKDSVKFRDLVLELLRLCPERRQMVLIPEMKAFIELSDSSKMEPGISQVGLRVQKTPGTDVLSVKISPNKNTSNTTVLDFHSSNTLDKQENRSVQYNSGVEVEVLAGSSHPSVILTPKLTPGQKVMLVRGSKEREKLLGEKVVTEKTLKERAKFGQKSQELEKHEVTENKKRSEVMNKWEREATDRFEASRDEDEVLGALESADFAMRPKSSDLQEVEEVELGADTEVDTNTEEDVNIDQKNGSQVCNSESEQACGGTETEQHVVKKAESCSNGLSEQSSPQDPATTSQVQPVYPSSVSRIVHSQNSRQTNVVHFAPSSSYKQASPVTVSSQKLPGPSACAITSNISSNRFLETYHNSNPSQPQSSSFEQAIQEITSVTSQDSQANSNYKSPRAQQQSSWNAKQLPTSLLISNDHKSLTLHSTSSNHPTSTYINDTFAASQVNFSPYSVQQRQISCKNLQSQQTPTVRHSSQHPAQEQIRRQHHGLIQHPYSYPSSTCSSTTTIQKATLPTCNIPHNASRVYNTVLSSQKVTYPQRSVSSVGSPSAFSILPQSPARQQQLMVHQSYNYQQQFLLQQQQQQQRQRQKQQHSEQKQNQMNSSSDRQMYSNW